MLLVHPNGTLGWMTANLSTNDLLLGMGLVLVLAVGSQLVAKLLRLPAFGALLLPPGIPQSGC